MHICNKILMQCGLHDFVLSMSHISIMYFADGKNYRHNHVGARYHECPLLKAVI